MRNEADEILDDILSRWYSWDKPRGETAGFAHKAAGMENYRSSRQYDDTNGALETDLEHFRCKQVDEDVRKLVEPYKSAIYANARNLCTGVTVWSNPRLPSDPQERAVVMAEARSMVSKRLLASGVL